MRVLFTDIMFPNKLAKWRLVETRSFIERYDTDFLCVQHLTRHDKSKILSFHWDELYESHSFHKYDIYIFNEDFRHLQKYNDVFDGTQFIGKYNGEYLLRLKKYRDQPISIETDYQKYYHLFLMCFHNFITHWSVPAHKHVIHMYPGGGATDISCRQFVNVHTKPKIITTLNFIHKEFENYPSENILYNSGGVYLLKDEIMRPKKITENFHVAFTSMGNPKVKGLYTYVEIAKKYKEMYPEDNIIFETYGNCSMFIDDTHVKNEGFKSQYELDDIYNETVDVFINLNNSHCQGFPLGIESGFQGCVLLSTDVTNQNGDRGMTKFSQDDGLFIIDPYDITDTIRIVKSLYDDQTLCHELGSRLQKKLYDVYSYENKQLEIFKFIEKE